MPGDSFTKNRKNIIGTGLSIIHTHSRQTLLSMKKFWNADKIVSISAMVISLGTLVVISYQTALISNQTEMIRKEQRIAVMPYLGFDIIVPSENRVELKVSNSGLGPAFIKEAKVEYQGKEYVDDLKAFYIDYFKPTNFFYNECKAGTVIQSGETLTLFGVNQSADPIDESMINGEVIFKFTYESAYGEAWVLVPPSTIPISFSETELE